MCDNGRHDTCNVDWADSTKTNRTLDVADSDVLDSVAGELSRIDLFKTRVGGSLGSAKAVTITVYYTTGTVVVQGNRCTDWEQEEFRALIDTIRAVYTLMASHQTQPELHKEANEGLCLLPLPSPDNTSMLTTHLGGDDSGVRPPFVNVLLEKVVFSPIPFIMGGCPPATPTPAVTTSPSSRPGHATPNHPREGQQLASETTSWRSDLDTVSKIVSHPSICI